MPKHPYWKEGQQLYRERIVTNTMAGKPVVKGTDISVDRVLGELSVNPDINQFLAGHPNLTGSDVQACFAYAARSVVSPEHNEKVFVAQGREIVDLMKKIGPLEPIQSFRLCIQLYADLQSTLGAQLKQILSTLDEQQSQIDDLGKLQR